MLGEEQQATKKWRIGVAGLVVLLLVGAVALSSTKLSKNQETPDLKGLAVLNNMEATSDTNAPPSPAAILKPIASVADGVPGNTVVGTFRIRRGGYYSVLKATSQWGAPTMQYSYGVTLDATSVWHFVRLGAFPNNNPQYAIQNAAYHSYLCTHAFRLSSGPNLTPPPTNWPDCRFHIFSPALRTGNPLQATQPNQGVVYMCSGFGNCLIFHGTASAHTTVSVGCNFFGDGNVAEGGAIQLDHV